MIDFTQVAPWTVTLFWTIATLAASWGAGAAIGALLATRMRRWEASGLQHGLVTSASSALRRRLPLWTLLTGAWIAAGYWPLAPGALRLAGLLIFAVGALSATFTAAGLAAEAVGVYGPAVGPGRPVSSLTRNIAWGTVATIGILMVLNGIGLSITPMVTALGIGGLAVALALQEPLANFFAGVFITLGGQIRLGDYVKLDSGQEGYVADFSWRSTRLRMLSNNLVVVPNARLAQAIVTNHHLPSRDLAVLVQVGVDYASDLARVERVVIDVGRDVMREVAGGVHDFEPFIRFHTFADSSVNFTVILRGAEFVDQYLITHEFIKRLHARFAADGIIIPFPIRTLVQKPDLAAGH